MNRYEEWEVQWKKKHDWLLALSIITLIICGAYFARLAVGYFVGL